MTRLSKQFRRRMVSPKRPSPPAKKTGAKKDLLEKGFKEHLNVSGAPQVFIPKIKSL
ncbi:MAG: hypothetical protein S4CHLAM7_14680 [Chlamydiae bacterium]|nr:hypothetical protein [Chlamydiota bacterium]